MQVCFHKIGAPLMGKLTICIDNAGLLWGHCIVAIPSHVPVKDLSPKIPTHDELPYI